MIAVDTSVLLRYLLHDDEAQAARADAVFDAAETVLVTDLSFVADGRITIVRKTAGAAKGFLRHVAGDRAVSDEESLQDALDEPTP